MYRRILLAYNGSQHSEDALRQATEMAKQCDADLHLLAIAQSMPGSITLAEPYGYDFLSGNKSDLEVHLNQAFKNLQSEGLQCSATVREGNPAIEIAKCAEAIAADLIIVGHSDKGFIARWLEGSVGAELVRNLPCSLLIATKA
ncbi:universal stress protein [Novosphingobium sp. PY1]|uniref:universal stress protein n=1 Tax=Novosphingobium sp. PY1 TaxID=1882221 RepID=UPI001AA48D2F|nr:universal stress protein [Novosphingobium sp. PY1]GFM30719.1 universal stress protein [Novosphingobium sp. PY1]